MVVVVLGIDAGEVQGVVAEPDAADDQRLREQDEQEGADAAGDEGMRAHQRGRIDGGGVGEDSLALTYQLSGGRQESRFPG